MPPSVSGAELDIVEFAGCLECCVGARIFEIVRVCIVRVCIVRVCCLCLGALGEDFVVGATGRMVKVIGRPLSNI